MSLELAGRVGIRLIVIGSKPAVVGWYERFGFSRLQHYAGRHNPVMYVDLLEAGHA